MTTFLLLLLLYVAEGVIADLNLPLLLKLTLALTPLVLLAARIYVRLDLQMKGRRS